MPTRERALAFVGILLLTAPASGGGIRRRRNHSRLLIHQLRRRADLRMLHRIHISLSGLEPRVAENPLPAVGTSAGRILRCLHGRQPAHDRAPANSLHRRLIAALLVAAALATAAAFSIQSWAQSILPSTHIALLLTMEPVFAWITSFLFMGERMGLRPACGALLILAGIGLTELVPQPHVPSAHEA